MDMVDRIIPPKAGQNCFEKFSQNANFSRIINAYFPYNFGGNLPQNAYNSIEVIPWNFVYAAALWYRRGDGSAGSVKMLMAVRREKENNVTKY